ncbi:MAG TPA: class I SAM-dependent methyltransferase [Chryseosolibacter sp.]
MNRDETCPLCGSTNTRDTVNAENFAIVFCSNCENYFTNPPPVLPDYEKLDFHAHDDSNKLEKLTYADDLPNDWKRLIHKQVNILVETVGKEANLLEIGCGEGLLLYELRKAGFSKIEGIEPSRTAFLRAQKKGLSVYNDFLENLSLANKYDVIVMSHVLEHVEHPIEYVRSLKAHLKPDGFLLFTQTNCEGLIARRHGRSWYAWVPEQHFWHFTERGLKKILQPLGFTVCKCTYTSLVHDHSVLYWITRVLHKTQDQFVILLKHKTEN